MLIRKATLADARHISQLVSKTDGNEDRAGKESYTDPHPWHRTLSSILSSPEWTCFLATDGDKKVGLLVFHVRLSIADGKKRATITELVINEGYSDQGIEVELVEEAKRSASAKGCTGLFATVDAGNEKSIAKFKRLGFRQDRAFLEMELTRPA
ncbi:MAG: GNAT family N-acetyltransferase [Actinomycetota bacterium]|nr:GNAT family N-acetyltransferase [Actinomycetota bacterium]